MSFDGAQLPEPLAFNDSEFSWYIFEGLAKKRRIAGLVSIHRTGPRALSVSLGPHVLTARDLPAPLRDLVPSWLPIISPVRVATDDRPLLMLALYDLDARTQPRVIEQEIEHADFDRERFAARSEHVEVVVDDKGTTIRARDLELRFAPKKPAVMFGNGSPELRHGDIATSYVQRPRLRVTGMFEGAKLVGEGVHDHQWLRVTVPNLGWIWPHLRLADGRELTGYVIRESTHRDALADAGRELGRAGWIIERDGEVRALPHFDVRATTHVDTERGRVPTQFRVEATGFAFDIDHVVPAPFLRMRAFGDVLDGGLYEGPIDVRRHPKIRGWIEVMNSSHVRFTAGSAESSRSDRRYTSR